MTAGTGARPLSGPPAGTAPTVSELEAEEAELQLTRFGNDDAWQLGALLVELARERGHAVTVDVRRGEQQLFHYALPGTSADNDAWIMRKIRVVRRFDAASYLVGQRFRDQGATFEEKSRLDPDRYAAHGGAFPLRVRGVGLVGTVAVSGLPQVEDHRLVVDGLRRYLADAPS
ncbi:heme-degrading domain-containing protein [Streptacidiphilus sp. EB129]|uniref:heme-degrading domain-containing protein n=1 Tax=Streptacidiphilus sp. EB129 TaxID=3156262 RepID=UPI003519B52C